MKNRFLLGGVILLCISICLSLGAYAKSQGTIIVNENANIEVAPDTVEFSVIIKSDDKTSLEKASSENKEISNKIYEQFRYLINKADGDFIKTTNYSARPVYRYLNGKQNLDKYEVTNTILVHTKNTSNAGSYIDKALKLGATNINGLSYTLSDTAPYCNDLLKTATIKAKTRAQIVSQAAGQTITGVKEIRTSCYANQARSYNGLMMSKMTMDSASGAEEVVTQTEGGSLKVNASVDAEFFTE